MNLLQKIFNTTKTSEKIESTLFQTKKSFLGKLTGLFSSSVRLREEDLAYIEEALYQTDLSSKMVFQLMQDVEQSTLPKSNLREILAILKDSLQKVFEKNDYYNKHQYTEYALTHTPHVILIVGINGVGKTTSVAKLAAWFKGQNQSVVLGAGDTFRAAAAEQLGLWAERLHIPIVRKQAGADPSSVVFDTLQSALAKKADVVLIDTAGRLHNKSPLMDELSKIERVMKKNIPSAPHEVLLVLDATTGQNAVTQTKEFMKYVPLTGLIVTKLDSSAKGGFILSIMDELRIPIKFIGVGEGIEDLMLFDPKSYIGTFFEQST